MATLSADTYRVYEQGIVNEFPVIASDIIYEGAAVGIVAASGHARPLTSADRFAGFAEQQADNSAGSAAAINVRCRAEGLVELTITGVTITDVDQPVYATDDNTFTMSPVGGVFVGFVHRWTASGKAIVRYDLKRYVDPHASFSVREAITGDKTLDSEDMGKLFWVTADAVVTLPAVATPALCKVVNGGSYGTVTVTLSPQAADSLEGPDITAADNKDVVNTGATAQRGDLATLGFADANGYSITELVGTWAREA